MLGAAVCCSVVLMRMGQSPYNSDVSRFMTGEAGPSDVPVESRLPFSCCLEEHVLYSKPNESFDPCHVPLSSPANWTRKEVSANIDWGKGRNSGADRVYGYGLTGWNGTDR